MDGERNVGTHGRSGGRGVDGGRARGEIRRRGAGATEGPTVVIGWGDWRAWLSNWARAMRSRVDWAGRATKAVQRAWAAPAEGSVIQ